MNELIRKKDSQRQALLAAIFEAVEGEAGPISYEVLERCASSLGLSHNEKESAFDWLKDKGRVEGYTAGSFKLTREGADEIEESLRNPDMPTEHFAPISLNIYGGTIGVIQNGSNNTANVVQNIAGGADELLKLIAQVRSQVMALEDHDRRSEAIELVDTLEGEAKSSAPKRALAKQCADGLKEYVYPAVPLLTLIAAMFAAISK